MIVSANSFAHSGQNQSSAATPTNNKSKGLELAGIFAQFGPSFLRKHNLPARHRKVMQQIINCRTAVLGGHQQWCAGCGFERYVYHSCRNRHCPKCQTAAKERWREARQTELLPVPYFHNVFTLPHELNELILFSEDNQRALIDLLFQATAATLLEFGRRTFGGQIGFTTVLHTWDQRLQPHFHLHCLIASGGLQKTGDGYTWIVGGKRFLFPVKGLSKMFRAKFLVGLKQLLAESRLSLPSLSAGQVSINTTVQRLFKKPWVVYSKPPFAGPRKLLDYLSRYTHRVALTNGRLLKIQQNQVTMSFRDRRDGDRRKTMTLTAHDLIGRFMRHVLPSRLMRIRHYGYLANRYKRERLRTIRSLMGVSGRENDESSPDWLAEWIESILGAAKDVCPCCGDPLLEASMPSQLHSAKHFVAKTFTQTQLRGPPS